MRTRKTRAIKAAQCALHSVASKCDGAEHADGQGFSWFHKVTAPALAAKRTLTADEAAYVRNLAWTYRDQVPLGLLKTAFGSNKSINDIKAEMAEQRDDS